jgi:hypothetical protein
VFSVVPLHQLEGDALGPLEEPQLSADVVHFVAQHGYAVGDEVRGGGLNVVDPEREVIESPFSQIRRVLTRIGPRGRLELEQLDLERRMRPFECEGDVLRFHGRHAHVPGGNATVDRRDVILSEAKKREERDRRAGVRHRDSNMIRIEYHIMTPCHVTDVLAEREVAFHHQQQLESPAGAEGHDQLGAYPYSTMSLRSNSSRLYAGAANGAMRQERPFTRCFSFASPH